MDKQIIACGRQLVNLLAMGLGCSKYEPLPDDVDIDRLLKMAQIHEVLVMAVNTLKQDPRFAENERVRAWDPAIRDHVWQSRVQHLELMGFCSRLAKANIPAIPLKGSVLKRLYPKTEFRQMCDLDVLVQQEHVSEAHSILTSMGYTFEQDPMEEDAHRDVFAKPPFMEIELHTRLLPDKDISQELFGEVWTRAIPPQNGEIGWQMSLEDFYFFFMLHFAKHYKFRGSGLRPILDLWLFRQKYGKELDQKQLDKMFAKTGLGWFRDAAEALAEIWFGNGQHDRETKKMEMNLFCSGGIYGSDKQYMRNHLMWVGDIDRPLEKQLTKLRFLLWRLFPPLRTMRIRYPILKRFSVFLPFFWIIRLADAIFVAGTKNFKEFIGIWKA